MKWFHLSFFVLLLLVVGADLLFGPKNSKEEANDEDLGETPERRPSMGEKKGLQF